MYCSKCGSRIPGNARYCPNCGTRQTMGVTLEENICSDKDQNREQGIQKARRRGRRLGNLLVSGAALLILFAGNEKVPDNIAGTAFAADASRFTIQNEKEMVICDRQGTMCKVDVPKKLLYSGDRRQMAYVDRDGELYALDHLDPVFVDDHVTDAKLSFYGDSVVYVRTAEDRGEELCIYNRQTKSIERLETEGCTAFAVSSDGQTAAFLEAEGGGTLSLWPCRGTKSEVAQNVTALLAVPDGGNKVLYQSFGRQICFYDGREEKELSSGDGNICLLTNENQTEFLYTEGKRAWYYCAGMEEPTRLSGVKGSVQTDCYPGDTAYQQEQGLILGRRTLKQMAFATYDPDGSSRLYYLDWRGAHAETIMNRADQFWIAGNGRSLLCLSEQKLYRIDDAEDPSRRVCLSGEQKVCQFAADPKFRNVWFATPNRELYFVKKGECVRLTGELNRLQGLLEDGVLFLEGQDLYFADGEEKTLIQTAVEEVWIQEQNYAVIDTDGERYYLKDLKDAVYLMGSR